MSSGLLAWSQAISFFLLFIFFPPFFHTPRAAVAGGREPRLCRNSEMLRIQALAALSVSQSFGKGEREGIKWEGIFFFSLLEIYRLSHQ